MVKIISDAAKSKEMRMIKNQLADIDKWQSAVEAFHKNLIVDMTKLTKRVDQQAKFINALHGVKKKKKKK